MRNLLFLGSVTFVMLSLSVRPALAITGGVVDDKNAYSNVGALLVVHAPNPDYPVPNIAGSGTLIHPQVLLTAGHVTAYFQSFWDRGIGSPADLRISFGVNAYDPKTWLEIEGVITHPDYNLNGQNPLYGAPANVNDVGVVILKKPVKHVPLAVLPRVGLLDELKATGLLREPAKGGTKLTVVGYGSRLDAPPPVNLDPDGLRRVAYSEYLGLSPDWLVLSQNFATGNGGGGYGDSGGPTFWTAPDGTHVLVAITSSGDPKLVNTGISQRIDISESLEFIEFVLWLMD